MRRLLSMLNKAIRAAPPAAARSWSVPAGRRVYAVGDIHGRLDLLRRLIGRIEQDDAARGPAHRTIVCLGDLVDRGPDSRGVIGFLMDYAASGRDCVFIGGNHDAVFVAAAGGDAAAASRLDKMGGRSTALSYGVTEDEYGAGGFDELADLLKARVPAAHLDFLRSFAEWHRIGDYIFVHAGIRPGKAMHDQTATDLRWIRRGFLDFDDCHGAMIVHGHTVTAEPVFRANRIGLDTGAFKSGTLTALGLEGSEQWLLST